MTNIEKEIQDYKNGRLDQNGKKWDRFVINPYSLAYHRAYDSFKKILADQAAFDKLKMDLMITGLSLFGGSVFTAVFGDITAKNLAGNIVVNHLNKSNNIKVLRTAGFIDNNPTAQFIIGEIWSKSSAKISAKAKSMLEPNPKNFPAVATIAQKPYEIEKALIQFKLDCEIKLFEVLDEIMKSNLSDNEKALLFIRAKNSQFCNPPSSNEYPANLADKIQLSFFMKYILETDYLVISGPGKAKKVPVKAIPGTKAYPKSLNMRAGRTEMLHYDRVGQIIIDEINRLYKDHYKSSKYPFIDSEYFGEHTNAMTLKRANIVLGDLAKVNPPKIKQLRAAPEAA